MIVSQKGLETTASFESLRLEAYQDPRGIWTIGYGHTFGVFQGMKIDQKMALEFLQEDMAAAAKTVNRLVTVPLTQDEFDALCDFAFNCGPYSLSSSTLLKLVNAKDFSGAARELLKWDHAGKEVLLGLLRRREEEAQAFGGGVSDGTDTNTDTTVTS